MTKPAEYPCDVCGTPIPQNGKRGRIKRYCTLTCRSHASHQRLYVPRPRYAYCGGGCGLPYLPGQPHDACRPWRTFTQRMGKYSMTVEQGWALMDAQEWCCALCYRDIGWDTCHIDHDHACCPREGSCGACVRALLCHGCNVGIASFGECPDRLVAAAAYVRAHAKSSAA